TSHQISDSLFYNLTGQENTDPNLSSLNSFNPKYWAMCTARSITKQQAYQFVIASISVCQTSNIKLLYPMCIESLSFH
ncbi:mCG1041136, partial [Mus musculus]